MTDLRNISDAALEAELARRKAKDEAPPTPIAAPGRVPNINFAPIIECCVFGIEDAAHRGYIDKNFEHYVYEAALEAVFGPTIWAWIRTLPGER